MSKKTRNNTEHITIIITQNGTQWWHAMLAQHENTAQHGKQHEHKIKSRHYMEHWGPHQTKHGTTRNNKSTLTQRTALHRNICGICTDHMF